ncbi:PEP-CTERM sorting domain-containing protein [Duganella levis]|uniref:PEP-CTERM sorting domain-containing protein n=1 Tax=Duganella levis TaxID=2692169 RepID=A0ABW9W562_9BURK|nr:PEP-CTERM sorting domain-containing protein [Duganella levis]MYN29093.1 PEP-CTERM sorting domain-containing protein [Duganella levis]
MFIKKLIPALGLAAMTAFGTSAQAAGSASGTVYFDWSALTATLQHDTIGFSGWTYASDGTALMGGGSDVQNSSAPDLLASIGSAKASTQSGKVSVETGAGGASQVRQQMTATFQLAANQHLLYSVGYTMVLQKNVAGERVDVGAGFIVDSAVGGYTISKTSSTLDWKVPVGTGSESNVLELDLENTSDRPLSFTVRGWLGAADSSPAITSSVPEPSSYALLLLGLAVTGIAVRRRSV